MQKFDPSAHSVPQLGQNIIIYLPYKIDITIIQEKESRDNSPQLPLNVLLNRMSGLLFYLYLLECFRNFL